MTTHKDPPPASPSERTDGPSRGEAPPIEHASLPDPATAAAAISVVPAPAAVEAPPVSPELSGEVAKFLYEQAHQNLDWQHSDIDELRTRAGTLLSAASIAAAFFGQYVLSNSDGLTWRQLLVPVGLYLATCAACIGVLWPGEGWVFPVDPGRIVTKHIKDGKLNYGRMAEIRWRHFQKNQALLKMRYKFFTVGCILLALDAGAWLVTMNFVPSTAAKRGVYMLRSKPEKPDRVMVQRESPRIATPLPVEPTPAPAPAPTLAPTAARTAPVTPGTSEG